MTIKQYGGVFGRNPTFNNVTVDGTLAVDQIVEKTGAAGITLDGVTLKDGNVVLANGNGIDFSATAGTGTSELLDDYEEGTWTPVYDPATGSFATITPVTSGSYVKIGRLVTAQFSVHTSGTLDLTGASGRLYFNGLPYAVSTGTFIEASGFAATVQRWNRGTDISTMRIAADPGQSRFYGTWNNVNGSVDYIDVADMKTAGGSFENLIQGTLIYSAP